MCDRGTVVPVGVLEAGNKYDYHSRTIDACIALLVRAFGNADIATVSSCCGHGKESGHIWMGDGRVLVILSPSNGESGEKFKDRVAWAIRGDRPRPTAEEKPLGQLRSRHSSTGRNKFHY